MEPAAAAIYERAKASDVRFTTFIGDEYSTTFARVRQVAGEFAICGSYSPTGQYDLLIPKRMNKDNHLLRPIFIIFYRL